MATVVQEFLGERSQLYKEVLNAYPHARDDEIKAAMNCLKPKKGERILESGAGSGLYSKVISDLIGIEGKLIATDPSGDQLENIHAFKKTNIQTVVAGADTLFVNSHPLLTKESFDAIWSCGSFHHCINKTQAFGNFANLLKKDGRLLIFDVFTGSSLAKYFDAEVSKFCLTGHEVAFLSHEFADSLCYLYGFSKPKFHDLNLLWKFNTKDDLGIFMYKLHGMTKTTIKDCLEKVEAFMKVEYKDNSYQLHVPLTILEANKL